MILKLSIVSTIRYYISFPFQSPDPEPPTQSPTTQTTQSPTSPTTQTTQPSTTQTTQSPTTQTTQTIQSSSSTSLQLALLLIL